MVYIYGMLPQKVFVFMLSGIASGVFLGTEVFCIKMRVATI